jgi:hypothetical protein
MRFRSISLTGMITGSGRVNLLSGQIRHYRVGFGTTTWCTPMNPLGRVGHARAVRLAGLRHGFGPNAEFN